MEHLGEIEVFEVHGGNTPTAKTNTQNFPENVEALPDTLDVLVVF